MGVFHGKNGLVKIGSNTVADLDSWTYTETVSTADTTTMGGTAETHLPGFTAWEGEASCLMDFLDTTGQEALTVGASVSLSFYPNGSTTGQKNRSGTATVTKVAAAAQKNGIATRSFSFKGNGALAVATNP